MSSWNDKLHDLGEAEVKHGVRVHLYNLYTEEQAIPSCRRSCAWLAKRQRE